MNKIKEIGEEERNFEANERRQRELENGTWYLRIDGKIFRDKTTKEPAAFNGKKHANAVANKMSALEFNKGKKFMLTRKPEDKPEEYPQRT